MSGRFPGRDGARQIVQRLEVHPKFRRRSKPVGKPQGCVGSEAAPSSNHFRDSVARNAQLPSQSRRAETKRL